MWVPSVDQAGLHGQQVLDRLCRGDGQEGRAAPGACNPVVRIGKGGWSRRRGKDGGGGRRDGQGGGRPAPHCGAEGVEVTGEEQGAGQGATQYRREGERRWDTRGVEAREEEGQSTVVATPAWHHRCRCESAPTAPLATTSRDVTAQQGATCLRSTAPLAPRASPKSALPATATAAASAVRSDYLASLATRLAGIPRPPRFVSIHRGTQGHRSTPLSLTLRPTVPRRPSSGARGV